MIGLQYLGNREPDAHRDVIFHGFSNIEDFLLSERTQDIVIYDPLNIGSFMVPNEDILRIEKKNSQRREGSISIRYRRFSEI